MIATFQDISKQKQTDKRLNIAAQVFENSEEAALVTDRNGDIQFVNRAFTKITGCLDQEVMGTKTQFIKIPSTFRRFFTSRCGNN